MPEVRDQQLPTGAGGAGPVEAKPAASTIVLRGDPFEVLFLRRASTSTFVPDAWIFPGGALDPVDRELAAEHGGDEQTAMRYCAARELFEEAGIWIGPPLEEAERWRRRLLDDPAAFPEIVRAAPPALDRLVWTSRWITPVGVPKRYDTWFFLLSVDDDPVVTIDDREGVEMTWLAPAAALRMEREGAFSMVFPTIRNLMALEGFDSREALLASRAGASIAAVQPLLVVDGGRKRIVLPGES